MKLITALKELQAKMMRLQHGDTNEFALRSHIGFFAGYLEAIIEAMEDKMLERERGNE